MWNTDKHKLLNLVVADFCGIMRNYLRGDRFIPEFTGLPGKLEDGAEFRIDFPDFYDPREMYMQAELGLRLEFEAIPGYAFETLLTDLVGFSERTVTELSDTAP